MLVDLRDALRGLGKNPGLTAVAVATLAVGIGASTALFSIVNAVLVRPLPFADPDGILSIGMTPRGGELGNQAAIQDYQAWVRDGRAFEALAAFRPDYGNLAGGNTDPEWAVGALVTRDLLSVLGVPPASGRLFTVEEDQAGGPTVAIISDLQWRRRFGASPSLADLHLSIEGKPYQVVGVMPPGFGFPEEAEYWVPFQLADEPPGSMSIQLASVIGRLGAGSTIEQARVETATLSRRLDPARSNDWLRGAEVDLLTLHDRLSAGQRPVLTLLLTAVGIVLLIACGNVAGLLLARASGRRRELATRAALGATRGRVARLLLLEGLLLGVVGALVGGLVAWGGVRAVLRLAPDVAGGLRVIPIDGTVLGFGVGLALLAGVVCGIGPALMASRAVSHRTARFGDAPTGRTLGTVNPRWVLVATEFAAAVVLLVGAGLFLRAFARVASIDPGFRAANVLEVELFLPEARYPSSTSLATDFFDRLVERARSIPGVRGAAVATAGPFQRLSGGVQLQAGGDARVLEMVRTAVGEDYFRVLGIVVAGRMFRADDRAGAPRVAIVNRSMARALFGTDDPVGHVLPEAIADGERVEVVGVSVDVRQLGMHREPAAHLYLPLAQVTSMPRRLFVLGDADANLLIEPIRRAVLEIDPAQSLARVRPLEELVNAQAASERTISLFVALFAAAALGLAVVGLYGVTAFVVNLRSREIAVRMAVGADRVDVIRLVVGHAMKVALIGIGAGIVAALAASRLATGVLGSVNPRDPVSYLIAVSVLLAAALGASYRLARRAARLDPVARLRES